MPRERADVTADPRIPRRRAAPVLVAAACALVPATATADRHCLPAQDAYFEARRLLLDESTSCPAAIGDAADALGTGVEMAGICGCGPLVDLLSALAQTAAEQARPCADRRDEILGRRDEVEATVLECHR